MDTLTLLLISKHIKWLKLNTNLTPSRYLGKLAFWYYSPLQVGQHSPKDGSGGLGSVQLSAGHWGSRQLISPRYKKWNQVSWNNSVFQMDLLKVTYRTAAYLAALAPGGPVFPYHAARAAAGLRAVALFHLWKPRLCRFQLEIKKIGPDSKLSRVSIFVPINKKKGYQKCFDRVDIVH